MSRLRGNLQLGRNRKGKHLWKLDGEKCRRVATKRQIKRKKASWEDHRRKVFNGNPLIRLGDKRWKKQFGEYKIASNRMKLGGMTE